MSAVFRGSEIVNGRLMAAFVWLLSGSAAAYLYWFEPGRTGFFPVCPFRAFTGFNCPGCGTTRALHQLLHGNVFAAFKLNPLLFLLLPLLAFVLILYTRSAITGSPMPQIVVSDKYIWVFSALILAFWVFRNLAVYPFPS